MTGHILVDYTAFDLERAALVRQIGSFMPGDLVSKILESPPSWEAIIGFSEEAMTRKEVTESAREQGGGI